MLSFEKKVLMKSLGVSYTEEEVKEQLSYNLKRIQNDINQGNKVYSFRFTELAEAIELANKGNYIDAMHVIIGVYPNDQVRDKIIERLKNWLVVDLLEEIKLISFDGYENIISNMTYLKEPFENIIDKLVYFFNNNYKPIADLLSSIEEYKSLVEYGEDYKWKHTGKNQISFNVKTTSINMDKEFIAESIINNTNIEDPEDKEFLYKDIMSLNWNELWFLWQDECWINANNYLKTNYLDINCAYAAGRSGGWMVIDYKRPSFDDLENIIYRLKNHSLEPGDYYFDGEFTICETYFQHKYNEYFNIEKDVKQFIKDYEEGFNNWAINYIPKYLI